MSKKCPKCGSKDIHITYYPAPTDNMATCYGCGYADFLERFPDQSIFDRITASKEVLAPKLVYVSLFNACWYSTLTGDVMYKSREEAEAATVEKLKEVAG